MAIIWGTKYFRPYLYGRKFTIVTDHKPLTWIFNIRDPTSRLMRWRLKLEEYEYKVVYKKGKLNSNADALSRVHKMSFLDEREEEDSTSENDVTEEEEEKSREKFEEAMQLPETEEGRKEEDGISEERKKRILKEFHDSPVGGHQGMKRTYERMKLFFPWPGMKEDVEDYIRRCVACQKNKLTRRKTKMPMQITSTPEFVFEKCCLDIVGPLPVTQRGFKYLLTFQDELSKFTLAIPLERQDATTIAKAFVEKIILVYGTPLTVLTDQGANFLSEIFKETCKILKIKKIQTTAFHPQSNGALERSHRTLTEYLRHYIASDQTNWDEWIPFAVFVFNTTPHTCTKLTPHEVMFGRKPNIPGCFQVEPKDRCYTYDDYLADLKLRMQTCFKKAREGLLESKFKSKRYYDRTSKEEVFQEGDKVLLYDESVRRGRSRKLSSQWVGPYIVIGVNGVNVTIKTKRKLMKVHANRLKLFY